MFGIGMGEFLLILIVGLIIFGPKNLPELGKMLGKGLKEFRKAQAALTATLEESVNEPVKKTAPETKSETSQEDTVKAASEIPKEIYTGTAAKVLTEKNSEPARASVDDLISTVKENPISNKTAEVSQDVKLQQEKSA